MKTYLCKHCIEALRSHGEQIFTKPIDYFDFDEEENMTCDFCQGEEEDEELYEVIY